MKTPFDYKNKCVIVTGGTKGIGLEIARQFLSAGAMVGICARSEPEAGKLEQDFGKSALKSLAFFKADLRNPEEIKQLVDGIEKKFKRIDVLVNNAGGSPPVPAKDSSPNFNQKIIELNLLAPLNLSIAAYPVMKRTGGVIINISSISGTRANPLGAAYGAAKAGLLNLTETLALEWGPEIRTVALTAGLIATQDAHLYYGDAQGVQKVGSTIAMKRMGTPEDIASACLFLASPQAQWISGSNLKIHGGGENPSYLQASTGEAAKLNKDQ